MTAGQHVAAWDPEVARWRAVQVVVVLDCCVTVASDRPGCEWWAVLPRDAVREVRLVRA